MPFDDDTLSVSSHTLIEQLTFGCVNWKDRKKCTSAAVLMSGLLSFLRSWDQSQWVRNRTWSGMWKWRRLKIHRNNSQKCDSIIVCFKNTLRTHFRFSSPAEWRRRTVKMENHLNALSPSRSPLRFLSLGFWLLFLYLFKLVNGGRFPIAPPFGFIYDFPSSLSNVMDIICVASAHNIVQLILDSGFWLRIKTQFTDSNVGQKFVWMSVA